jgi:DNA-binding NarL/FixJ family response regulator
MKILYLDPDDYYRQKLQQQTGPLAQVFGIREGREAFPAMQTHKPDVLIMELLLNDEHGHLLLERIRRHTEFSRTPVIVFSTLSDLEDMRQALNLGISGFFVKGKNSVGEVKELLMSLS